MLNAWFLLKTVRMRMLNQWTIESVWSTRVCRLFVCVTYAMLFARTTSPCRNARKRTRSIAHFNCTTLLGLCYSLLCCCCCLYSHCSLRNTCIRELHQNTKFTYILCQISWTEHYILYTVISNFLKNSKNRSESYKMLFRQVRYPFDNAQTYINV